MANELIAVKFIMKNSVCVTLFIVSSFWEICRSENYESAGENSYKNIGGEMQHRKIRSFINLASEKMNPIDKISFDSNLGESQSYNFNFGFDEGNPDTHGDIQRPCQAYDTFCIRKFFADHSRCKVSGKSLPDPLFRDEGTVYFSSNNMSASPVPALYSGLNNARVSEFYINKLTDNLVISITFESVSKTFSSIYFKYYLRGREPIVTRDAGNIQYGVLTVTVIIPNLKDLRFDRSEIYTYGDDSLFTFVLGPRIGLSSDPEVVSMYARFFTNIPNEYQEEISDQGFFMVGNYIQYNICDFGLKIP